MKSNKKKELIDMQAMKEKIPDIVTLKVGFSKGWAGQKNQIIMTVDFETKADFETFITHSYHADYINRTGIKYFEPSSFTVAQFEF